MKISHCYCEQSLTQWMDGVSQTVDATARGFSPADAGFPDRLGY